MITVDVGKIKINFMSINKGFFYTDNMIGKSMKNHTVTQEQKTAKNTCKFPCLFDRVLYTKKCSLDHIKWSRRGSEETLHIDANITTKELAIMLRTILIVLIHYINNKLIKYFKIFQIVALNSTARYGPSLKFI